MGNGAGRRRMRKDSPLLHSLRLLKCVIQVSRKHSVDASSHNSVASISLTFP
jgi:hypothetical protein